MCLRVALAVINKQSVNSMTNIKTIIMSVRRPAAIYVSDADRTIHDVRAIQGKAVRANDSLVGGLADLIIDPENALLLGLEFKGDDDNAWIDMRTQISAFDPKALRLQ